MQIGICDGEAETPARLSYEIKSFAKCAGVADETVVTIFSNAAQLFEAVRFCGIDLLFLGTQLSNESSLDRGEGLELARRIRLQGVSCRIVFLSRTATYAPYSYDVNAFYYLLKPLRREKLLHILEQVMLPSKQRIPLDLTLKTTSGLLRISRVDLLYIENTDHQQVLHFRGGTSVKTASRMSDLSAHLSDDPLFIMPHRAYIVNLAYVSGISGKNFLLIDGTHIPISKKNYPASKQAYLNLFPKLEVCVAPVNEKLAQMR